MNKTEKFIQETDRLVEKISNYKLSLGGRMTLDYEDLETDYHYAIHQLRWCYDTIYGGAKHINHTMCGCDYCNHQREIEVLLGEYYKCGVDDEEKKEKERV